MTPTPEQSAIILAATTTTDNLLVQALAGAAKTSTLVMVAEALSDVEILCLAFNKKIAVEMQERLPSNCKAMTLNALGHRTWMEATGRRIKISLGKTFTLLAAALEKMSSAERKACGDFAELMRTINFGKQCGYIPTGHYEKGKRLMDDEEFFNHVEQELSDIQMDLVRKVTLAGIEMAMKGECDFDDQIFMPTLFHGAFPRYPLVLVDEAQDLSALNHATLRKLCKKRLIAVGDSRQAIYGFRGAHEESMDKLAEEFSMTELTLSVSFRCASAIVSHAQWRAPHMRAPSWAVEGEVKSLHSWGEKHLPESAAVICRNNAPLFSLAMKLLKDGRHCEVGNADITKALIKIMRKFGDRTMNKEAVMRAIDMWEVNEKRKNKKRAHASIEDRADCMRVFTRHGDDLGEAIGYAEHLCNATGPLKLLTGHKAKGLEFSHVFFLDNELIGDEGQENNLRYVIQTRAKETLTYVSSKNYESHMAPSPALATIPN